MIDFGELDRIRAKIGGCDRDVVLVAACKTQDKATVDRLMAYAPDLILGENRVQELTAKYDPRYRWHFIGRLQTNKVKYIVDKAELIHSLDRMELAAEIDRQAAKRGKIQSCLVEVNVGGELSKGGVSPQETEGFIRRVAGFANIGISGLMAVMPNLEDKAKLHALYADLQRLYEKMKQINLQNVEMKYLSAGMSGDYEIALEHGANMIRLGRAIFGERVYSAEKATQK